MPCTKSYSPLRYPGGKGKLFNYTKQLIINNNLENCIYIEPFAGGSGLAMILLLENIVSKVILNDIDRSIYAFWYSVLNYTDDLCKLISSTPVNLTEWEKQKKFQSRKDEIDLLTLGFSTFYLNRTNRSGIINAGPIGGQNQISEYKIDCRFNKTNLLKRINRIADNRNNIKVYNYDAEHFISRIVSRQKKKSFVFLDPPYYKKGPGLYMNSYKYEDHVRLSKKVCNHIRCKWIVTYDNHPLIKDMYQGYRQNEYTLTHTASKSHKGKEIMIYSHDMIPLDFEEYL